MTRPVPHSGPLLRLDADLAPLAVPADFAQRAEELGVAFDAGDPERLGMYLALLLHANESLNLTGITDPAEAWTKHILDAVGMVPLFAGLVPDPADQDTTQGGKAQILRVIDVGAGGGVPGIPLAILLPDIHVTLLEATGKKAEFLRIAVKRLALTNVTVLSERAEVVGQDHHLHREKYDVGIARALGRLVVLAELVVPLVRPGGHIFAVKGAKAEEELAEAAKALGLLGARHAETIETPTAKIVVLEKTIRTPRLYPRKDGEPKRAPLGIAKS